MNLDEQIQKEANRQLTLEGGDPVDGAPVNTPVTPAADAAPVIPPVENPPAAVPPTEENKDKQADAALVDAPADKNTAQESTPSPNLLQHLDRLSGGRIKTMEDFTSALTLSQETAVLKTKIAEYEAKMAVSPFADEFEQKRNELKKSGAEPWQLKAFERLHEAGDLKDMDPKEAIITKMILVDKIGEKVARLKVDKMYNLDELEGDDLEIAKSDMEQDSIKAKKDLESFKVQISTPNSDKVLLDAAGKAQLQSQLKPTLDLISGKLNILADVKIPGANGEPETSVTLDLNTDDKAFITGKVQEIMIEENLPLTKENLDYAIKEAKRDFLELNTEKIISNTWAKADAYFTKKLSEKYENTGGKPQEDVKPAAKSVEAETRAFKDELLGRNTNR